MSGEYFFFPGWRSSEEGLDHQNVDFQTKNDSIGIVPEFITPSVNDTGMMYIYAAAFRNGTLDVSTLASDVASAGFEFSAQ